ncbi:hypothetical protein CC80DRAFT_551409 [Byssothecium circinans]|uniref:Uncharacterized protein n=1 Tax=Byssothecium circinans TaxID=147558 RepID=A0A6A5TRF3_9PLEO|nr:hypothetical protein CC80DRAFT_551409 [Byssothecium circinans]
MPERRVTLLKTSNPCSPECSSTTANFLSPASPSKLPQHFAHTQNGRKAARRPKCLQASARSLHQITGPDCIKIIQFPTYSLHQIVGLELQTIPALTCIQHESVRLNYLWTMLALTHSRHESVRLNGLQAMLSSAHLLHHITRHSLQNMMSIRSLHYIARLNLRTMMSTCSLHQIIGPGGVRIMRWTHSLHDITGPKIWDKTTSPLDLNLKCIVATHSFYKHRKQAADHVGNAVEKRPIDDATGDDFDASIGPAFMGAKPPLADQRSAINTPKSHRNHDPAQDLSPSLYGQPEELLVIILITSSKPESFDLPILAPKHELGVREQVQTPST